MIRNCIHALLPPLLLAAAGIAMGAQADRQAYPQRPVRLLVPSPPGGPSDFAARLVSTKLSEALGQNVVVDSRQSVNGVIATEMVARAAPDGLTIGVGNIGTHVVNVSLYAKLPYDPIRDFVPIGQMVSAGTAWVATPKLAPRTMKEFIAAAKKEPGKFNVGIAGAGGVLATEVLKAAAGIQLVSVPYKGSAPTEIAIMSGESDVAMISIPVAAPQVRNGRMKAYGVTTTKRSVLMPDVPTIAETGVENFAYGNWHALFAPAGTPDRIVRLLHREVTRILMLAETREIVANRGNEIIAGTPEALAAVLKREIPRTQKLLAAAGVKPQ